MKKVQQQKPPKAWRLRLYASAAMGQRAQDFAFKTDIFGVGVMA